MSENNNTTKNNTNALLLCTANMVTTFHSTTKARFSSQDHTMTEPSPVGMHYLSTPALVPGVGFVLERTWRSVTFAGPFPLPPSRLNCSAPPICLFRLAGVERRAETNCRSWTLLITVMKYLEVCRAWSRPNLVYRIERSWFEIREMSCTHASHAFFQLGEWTVVVYSGTSGMLMSTEIWKKPDANLRWTGILSPHPEGKTILKSLKLEKDEQNL